MLIHPHALDHWINYFYGYGSWQARMWFVAHEEGGGDIPEEVAEKLDFFYRDHASVTAATLCEIRPFYKNVGIWWEGKSDRFRNRYEYRFGHRAQLYKVWENLIRFACGYRSEGLPEMLEYQRLYFVGSTPKEALIKLYPLPGASHHGWNYNWLELPGEFNFLKSRTQYEDHIYPSRINTLMTAIQKHKPEVVLMYGMNNINKLKGSVTEYFPDAQFTLFKSIKQQIPQHHWTHLDGTDLLITTQIPALRHRRVETGFDWYAFGEGVSSYRK